MSNYYATSIQRLCFLYLTTIQPLYYPYSTPIPPPFNAYTLPTTNIYTSPYHVFLFNSDLSPLQLQTFHHPQIAPKTSLKLLTAHNRCKGTTFLANTQEITNIFLPQYQKLLNTTPTTATTPTVEKQHYLNNYGNIKRPVTLTKLGMLLQKFEHEEGHTRKGNSWSAYQYDTE